MHEKHVEIKQSLISKAFCFFDRNYFQSNENRNGMDWRKSRRELVQLVPNTLMD